jgi:hypothetical protein
MKGAQIALILLLGMALLVSGQQKDSGDSDDKSDEPAKRIAPQPSFPKCKQNLCVYPNVNIYGDAFDPTCRHYCLCLNQQPYRFICPTISIPFISIPLKFHPINLYCTLPKNVPQCWRTKQTTVSLSLIHSNTVHRILQNQHTNYFNIPYFRFQNFNYV